MVGDKIRLTPIDGDKLEDGIGLCLSGGGYRAMLFHVGAIYRLNELGLLQKLNRVSSVSGGSMAAAALAIAYPRFQYQGAIVQNLEETLLQPVMRQADDSIDVSSGFAGLNPFSSAAEAAARSYEENLTRGAKLADLKGKPLFVFNATSLMTGNTVRFRPDYVADYMVGQWRGVSLPLSEVVAASAAFPPFLSPAPIDLSTGQIEDGSQGPLSMSPFTGTAILTDGGVYDNLGTETVWKRYRTILVSNAGRPFTAEETPKQNWLQQSLRIMDIAMDQSEDLRERILAHAYEIGARTGAMWSLGTGARQPSERPPLLSEDEWKAALAVSTRLWRLPKTTQALLLKAGYAHAASRIRSRYGPASDGPADVPDGRWPEP